MTYETIKLWETTPDYHPEYNQPEPYMEVCPVDNPRGCVVVCPGGGYEFLAFEREGRELAEYLNSQGYYAYILFYRIGPYRHPVEQSDVNRAIRLARYRAAECGYPTDRIAVIGSSAGGHLAMTACTKFDGGKEGDAIDRISCRPDLGVFCYGVLTLGTDYTHWGTTYNLLGKEYDPALAASLSATEAVRPDMPPCFIWHTVADDLVPVQNALTMAEAMGSVGVPYELHIYPFGGHGQALCFASNPHASGWAPQMISFFGQFWK